MDIARKVISAVIILMGVAVMAGGLWLITLGGSPAYAAIGLVCIVAGGLAFLGEGMGLFLYGLGLFGMLAWALYEVGPDWWQLSARGSLLMVLGILLLIFSLPLRKRGAAAGLAVLALGIAVAAAVGVYAMTLSPHDVAGRFDDNRMAMKAASLQTDGVPPGEWQAYGRTVYGRRYSPLDQITPQNVASLGEAWRFTTGQIRDGKDPTETTYEVTPLVVGDTMYICTPFATVIALDPVTGHEKWRFDPLLKQPPTPTTQHMTCRGVTFFDGSKLPHDGAPATASNQVALAADASKLVQESASDVTTAAAGVPQNIVTGNARPGDPNPLVTRKPATAATAAESPDCVKRLFVPTSDGRLIAISAETGHICPGFGGEDGTINLWANMPNVTPGSTYATSPPLAAGRLIVVGGAVNDNASTTSPSGVIRAFDAFTGDLVWNFDSKNPDQTAPIAAGQTYTENAPNSWSVSSYDPALGLIYVPMGNESPDQYGAHRSPAVEKYSSSIVALDASTGKPQWVFQTVHHDLWDMDVPAQPSLLTLTINGHEVPALVQATKQGEVYVLDRRDGTPLLPVKDVPAPTGAVEGDHTAPTQPVSAISFNPPPLTEADMWGATLLDQLACRIAFRQLDYKGRYTPPSERGAIVYPGNFGTFNWGAVAVDPDRQIMFGMPVYLAFTSQLVPRPNDTARVVTKDGGPVFNENFGAPFAAKMGAFLSPLGLPCQAPPWGYVAGVDLVSGKIVYRHVNGTVRDLSPLPLPFEMGVPGIGGPIVTRGGVAFLSGALDNYVRGYDLATGAEIWRARLPAGGQATPSTYLGRDKRQYLVVVAGGHGSTGTKAGDSIIAYALPRP